MAVRLIQRGQVRGRETSHVDLVKRLVREGEQTRTEAVTMPFVVLGEALRLEGAQESQRGGLVHVEQAGKLVEGFRSGAEVDQDTESAVDGLAHAAPASASSCGCSSSA